ncbi:MAG: sigma 54-interacting transcriptional regulator [Pyrinomonadaceae bacterium]
MHAAADDFAAAAWSEREAGPLAIRVGTTGVGAVDDHQQVISTMLQAASHRLRAMPGAAHHHLPRGPADDAAIIAADPNTQKLLRLVRQFAALDGSGPHHPLHHIMVLGERGVGKELIAQALHRWSARAEQPFRAVNMGRITGSRAREIFGARRRLHGRPLTAAA